MILINISLKPDSLNSNQNLTRVIEPFMYVCLCKAITDNQIREAVENGATHFRQVRQELGLASQCGKCGLSARDIFNESLQRTTNEEQLFYAVS